MLILGTAAVKAQNISTTMATDTTVYSDSVLNVKPEFPGGTKMLLRFLVKTIRYPAKAHERNIQGKVIGTFIVEKDGTLTNLEIKKSVAPSLDDETLRIMKLLPKFTPGMLNDQPVRTRVNSFPLSFTLAN